MAANLITTSEYKEYKGINSTAQDAQIEVVIGTASALVKNICKNTFVDYVQDSVDEYFNGGETDKLYLGGYPILTVNSVSYSTDFGQTYTVLTEYLDYVWDRAGGCITSLKGTWPYGLNAYKVCYNSGYETLPADLKNAVMDLVSYILKGESTAQSATATDSSSVNITYVNSNALPAHIKRVLDLYTSYY